MDDNRSTPPLSSPIAILSAEPDLVPEHKQAIISALQWAWSELCTSNPAIVLENSEEEITMRVERLLNEQTAGKRRAQWLNEFETVTRGSKVKTAGKGIEKQPDLHFRPPRYRNVRQLSDWAWFVECKIINGAASVELYCVQGIQRFSSGEYGARMATAGMVAYVRDNQRPFDALNSKLAGRFATISHTREPGLDQSRSGHRRDHLAQPCVDIELTHIWLRVI